MENASILLMNEYRPIIDVGVDAATWLDRQDDASADALLTSPPYWCQRRYGADENELGIEPEVHVYVERLAGILDRARRVLKPSGWMFINIGDTYANQPGGYRHSENSQISAKNKKHAGSAPRRSLTGLPYKSMACVPDRLKIAMLDRGWRLRNTIIWAKPNPLPATVTDRWWNTWEPILAFTPESRGSYWSIGTRPYDTKPKHDVWMVAPQSGRALIAHDGHPAGMPYAVIARLIDQAVPVGGTVIDPFAGSGSVLRVASMHQRHGRGCDLYSWVSLGDGLIDVVQWATGESLKGDEA